MGLRIKMAKKKTKSKKKTQSKLRIKLRAYDHKVIDSSAKKIVEVCIRYGADVVGPVPLPTETHKYTVNRATFVHNPSKAQYEIRVHKRLIDVMEPNQRVLDALRNLNLPAGVDIEMRM